MIQILLLLGVAIANNLRFRAKGTIPNLWNIQASTCYGVMFDAGSSGTRVYVYSWNCRETQTMPYVSLSEKSIEKKVKPGISSFATKLNEIPAYLQPLIDFALSNIPKSMKAYTPIMLGATAGMRLLPVESQTQIMKEVQRVFLKSGLLFLSEQWARVITGQEEGAYMWLSLNYLLQTMSDQQQVTTIDLGGASTQISFKPKGKIEDGMMDLIIPNLNEYEIFSSSYLLFGMDQALIQVHKQFQDNDTFTITTPCYFSGYENVYEYDARFKVIGQGNYQECRRLIRQYLNNDPEKCQHSNCGINGQYQPKIDGDIIYGISGIQSMVNLFGFENYTLTQYSNKVVSFTSLVWSDIEQIPEYISNPYITTDYFSSIYVDELLSYGYGISRDQLLYSPDEINNISPSWTVAAMFYQLAQIQCQYDSPVCIQLIK
ncbi:unnamed protein product (macronuclear) [Paramecium tetraurelia]|uniref:Uncharacterized protein n=1 Tax=Paramecium tetraurelia TaxID=5888 RepID=A0CC10_PARTE|nr:uncharacterized protein GSPATT00037111001 [Paramecium tetraurelia]CAK68327.1 unnamed protein product [Paramecium tetraurelia]|eukprot:XP_001435724.1 hypothetical protein (macronuclear) [Paramecium tetraurelia strain d4-2]